MTIEFDPAKDQANIAKHGVSLALAEEMDLASARIVVDDRYDYGETRYWAFGRIERRLYVLVFVNRDGALRAISLRKANGREVTRYG